MFEWFKNLFSNKQTKEEGAEPMAEATMAESSDQTVEESGADEEDDQSGQDRGSDAEEKPSRGGLVVGEILEINDHPNADKLVMTRVNVGEETLDIVCGARNIKPGDKVPVALVGTILPNGMEIKAAEIRGQKSYGMLCAEDELQLGDDHSGILILPAEAEIGQSVDQYIK